MAGAGGRSAGKKGGGGGGITLEKKSFWNGYNGEGYGGGGGVHTDGNNGAVILTSFELSGTIYYMYFYLNILSAPSY